MSTALRTYSRGYDLISMQTWTGDDRVYHFDHQGTTQTLTDGIGGAVTNRFASDAWGVQVKQSGSTINRHWYIGNLGYYSESGNPLTYVRSRYLNCESATWLAQDLVREVRNLYKYLFNPTIQEDPTGRLPVGFGCEKNGWGCCHPLGRVCFHECPGCVTASKVASTLDEFCGLVDDWKKIEPEKGGDPGSIACVNAFLLSILQFSQVDCQNANPKYHDKCMHCVMSARFAQYCSLDACLHLGWCKEMQDLTDCDPNTNYEISDWNADQAGCYCSKTKIGSPDLKSCCGQWMGP